MIKLYEVQTRNVRVGIITKNNLVIFGGLLFRHWVGRHLNDIKSDKSVKRLIFVESLDKKGALKRTPKAVT